MDDTKVSNISTVSFAETIGEDFARVAHLFPARASSFYTSFFEVFPSSITSFYGYEISLGKDDDLPDLLLCIHKPKELLNLINEHQPLFEKNNNFFERLQKFAFQWNHQKQRQVSNVWLEYDFEEMVGGNYVPNFFIGPAKNLHPMEVLLVVNELFHTSRTEKEAYRNLLTCYRNLPKGAWISQIGRMAAREESNLRLFIQDLPKGSIPEFLDAINYTGVLNEKMFSWLDLVNQVGNKVDLDLDVSSEVAAKMGVEVYCNTMEGASKLLRELFKQGYCTESKFEKLSNHFSLISISRNQKRHHFLSHFKLVYDGVNAFAAKVYLGFVEDDQTNFVAGTKP